jgi:hypothetical protein
VSSEFPKFAVSVLSLIKVYKIPYLIRSSKELSKVIQVSMTSVYSEFYRGSEFSKASEPPKLHKALTELSKVHDEFSQMFIDLAGLVQARSEPLTFRPSKPPTFRPSEPRTFGSVELTIGMILRC